MIVKIQKPLGGAMEKALVYNEDRSFHGLMPWEQCAELFGPDDLKIYVMAKLEGTVLFMGDRIKDQPW